MGAKDKLKQLKEQVTRGLEEAQRKMIKFKIYKNSPVVVSQNGRVVKLDPNSIDLEK